jgi:replicative DNA helicase
MSAVFRAAQSPSPADDEVARLRVPPHSVEAEQSVLGGLLIDNLAWDRAGDQVTESDFYRYEHREIFVAIAALINANKPADVITVFEQLQNNGKAEACGGLKYLNDLAQSVPSAANLRRYAEIVRERAILRKLISASDEIATNAFNPQGRQVSQILDEAEGKIFKIGEEGSRNKQGFIGIDKLTMQLIDRVTELAENGAEDVTGVRTGFYDMDRMMAGMQKGDLIILAARPSMGKTAFALNIAEYVAVNEELPVLVFSMEMGASQLALRMIGSLGRIDQSGLRTGRLRDDEWTRLTEAAEKPGQGADVHRRDAGAEPGRAARPLAPHGAAVRRHAGPDRRRLPAADERHRQERRREPRHRDQRDLARAEGAGQGTAVPGDCAVAAEPLGRDPHRQAADDERPA